MLAAALAPGPSGVLLDEPTVGQDRATWAAIVGTIGSAASAGVAVGVATHDAAVVASIVDQQICLVGGRVVG